MPFVLETHPVVLVVCLAAAALFTAWTYRRTTPPVTPARKWVLGSLRFVAVALVLVLLFDPVLRTFEENLAPPTIAVLVDDSESMSLAPSEGASWKDGLRQSLSGITGGEVRFFRFSSDAQPLPEGSGWPDSLTSAGPRTDLSGALDGVREQLKDHNLRGVVLVSDGQYNTGRNPVYTAERYPVPVYTVVVGDTTTRRDVQINRITTNDIAFLGAEQPVRVTLRSEALPGERVTVSLTSNGRVLDSKQATLPPGSAEVSLDMAYTPSEAGVRQYGVSVSRAEGEVTYRNNVETFSVRVMERRRRVLLVGAAPDPDLAALRQVLDGNEDIEVTTFIQKSRGQFFEGPFPASLDGYELIILAGYPGSAADPAAAGRIAGAARGGTPVLFILGTRTDPALVNRYFRDVLPAAPEVVRPSFVEVSMAPEESAVSHPVFAVSGITAESWGRLPPLGYNESRWRAAPDARILAATRLRGVSLRDPLFVIRSRGGVRSAAFLGAGTWRWKNLPRDLEALSEAWPGMLVNLVQWLGAREDNRPLRVEPSRDAYAGGEPVRFTGRLLDESLNPISQASIHVVVASEDAVRYPFQMEALGGGRYVLDVGTLPEGSYTYTASARRDTDSLGSAAGRFTVGALALEFKETRANAALMQQIAVRSGGSMVALEELQGLPERLRSSPDFIPLRTRATDELPLRRMYGFFLVILALLTTEWFLRKRSGMV